MSLRFEFSVDDDDVGSSWDLGHMTIRSDDGIYSSQGTSPSQAMMIFPSIAHLVHGVILLLSSKQKDGEFTFHATDSSYLLRFKLRDNKRTISIESADRSFSTQFPTDMFVNQLLDDISVFWKSTDLPSTEPIYADVSCAIDKLRQIAS